MALIQCPECKKEISDKSETCIHCGFPIKKQVVQGKGIFQTSDERIALLAKYIIKDESGNDIVKLKNNDSFELPVDRDTRLFMFNWKLCLLQRSFSGRWANHKIHNRYFGWRSHFLCNKGIGGYTAWL